MALGLEPSNLG